MLFRRRPSQDGDRYARYPFVVQFDEGRRSRVQAYTLVLYAWMNDMIGPIGVAWDVRSGPEATHLYFATHAGYDRFQDAWGALLDEPMPPDLSLPIVPWPTSQDAVVRAENRLVA